MKFIIGEDGLTWLSRIAYRGTIGLFYENTLGGILAYMIFAIVVAFALIGLFTVIKWFLTGKQKSKKTTSEYGKSNYR